VTGVQTCALPILIRALAATLPLAQRLRLRALLNRRLAPLVLARLPQEQRNDLRTLLCNTVTPTRLRAGIKTNVIPSQAEAELDCRLLPGQMPDDAMREIRALIGSELALDPLKVSPGVEFDADTELFRLLQSTLVAHDPAALPVPHIAPLATDARQYARLGMTVYGFTPGQLPEGTQAMRLMHGHDERIPIASLHFGVRVLWDVVKAFCC